MKRALILIFIIFLSCLNNTKKKHENYLLLSAIKSNHKNTVLWAEQFLIKRGFKIEQRIDFSKTKSEELDKVNNLMNIALSIKNKKQIDVKFLKFTKTQSPYFSENEWK